MKSIFLGLLLVIVSPQIKAQNIVSVPFVDGFIGVLGNNTQSADNIQNFSTLGIERVYFSQNSSGNIFEVQGNDIVGTITLVSSVTGQTLDVPGAIVWRITSGSTLEILGFIPAVGNPVANLSSIGLTSYQLDSDSNYGLKLVSSSLLLVDGTNISGNAASTGLLTALNNYLIEVQQNAPLGPVTVDDLTTTDSTPTISGTVNLASGEIFSVVVNGQTFDSANGVSIDGTNWMLTLPQTNLGTYSISAFITNTASYTLSAIGSLTIQDCQTGNDVPAPPISGGDITSCETLSAQNLVATASVNTGESITWYDAATGGNLVADPSLSTPGTVTYFAEATNDTSGCVGQTRTAVTLTIEAAPSAPTGDSEQTFCDAATVADLTVTGDNIQWYDAATGGNLLDSTTALTDGQMVYASQTVNGCESTERLEVTVSIQDITITASATEVCTGESVDLSVFSNGNPANAMNLSSSLGTDLVSYWPFNGNEIDESNNGSTITNNGATLTSDRNGMSNSAFAFNGSQSMTFDTSSAYANWTEGVTVSVWFFLNNNYNGNPRMFYIGQTDSNNKGIHLMVQTGNIGYVVSPGGGVGGLGMWSGVNAVPTGAWHHALFRANFSTGDSALFIDGQMVNSGTNTNQSLLDALSGVDYSTNPGNIGQKTGGGDKWQGKLDDIAVWKRLLSDSEILKVFNLGQPSYTWSTGDTTANISVTPTETTEYWVDVTTNGVTCREYITIDVTSPAAPTGDAQQTFCEASTVTDLTAMGENIQWYDSATGGNLLISTTALTDGQTVHASQTVNGCESTERLEVTVYIDFIDIFLGDDIVACTSESIILDAGAGFSEYLWSTGETTQTIEVTESGNYSVEVTNSNTAVTEIWINGVLEHTMEFDWIFNNTYSDYLYLGSAYSEPPNSPPPGQSYEQFIGSIDNVEIWNRKLSSLEINSFMNCPPIGNETGLLSYWNFENSDGLIFSDLSQNNNSGEFFNANIISNSYSDGYCIEDSNAVSFDHQTEGSYLRALNPVDNDTDFTVSMWINPSSLNSGFCHIYTGGYVGTAPEFSFYIGLHAIGEQPGEIRFTSQNDYRTYTYLDFDQWQYLTIARRRTPYTECSTSDSINVTFTSPAAPTGPLTQSFCDTATIADLTATGDNIQWYDAATGGNLLDSTTALTDGQIVYASQTVNGCESTDRLEVTVSIQDITLTASATEVCAGDSVDLSVDLNLPTICDMQINLTDIPLGQEIPGFTYGGFYNEHYYYVYNDPTSWTDGEQICRENGGYLVCINDESENTFVSNLTNNNIWIGLFRDPETCEFRWLDCIDINYTNWRPGEPNSGPCGEPYTQIIRGCSFGYNTWNNLDNNSSNGACYSNMVPIMEIDPEIYQTFDPSTTYLWSTGDTTETISVTPTETTEYWVDVTTNGVTCREYVTINVTAPAAPTGNPVQGGCSDFTVGSNNNAFSGENLQWYATPSGGNALPESHLLVDGTYYYISQTVDGCESSDRFEFLYLAPEPTITIESPTICEGDSTTVSVSSSPSLGTATFLWNTGETSESITLSPTESTTFWVDQIYNSGGPENIQTVCRYFFGITVDNAPEVPISGGDITECETVAAQSLTAIASANTGESITWYDAATGGNVVTSPSLSTAGTVTYYAEATNDTSGCTSLTRTAVTLTITSVAAPTGDAVQSFCDNITVSDLSASGSNIQWYDAAIGGNLLDPSSALSDGQFLYASQTENSCESITRLEVSVEIDIIPDPILITTELEFCLAREATLADLEVDDQGFALEWYDSFSGGNMLPMDTLLEDGVSYYATLYDAASGCESLMRLEVVPTVIPCEVFVYNALSLNDNGLNDHMVIEGSEYFPENTLQIFNRDGHLVYEKDQYGTGDNLFRGIANVNGIYRSGSKMPTGSYLYVFRYFNPYQQKEFIKKGFLMINSN